MKKAIITMAALAALGACVDSSNGGAKGYTVTQANKNAISIKTSWGNFGDHGAELAAEHCGQYGKVATLESGAKAGFVWRYTYTCR